MNGLEESAKSRDPNAFCDAAQAVADAVMGMVQAATQSAYLVGAGEACNEVGRAPRLTQTEANQIAEDTECLHRDLEIIIRDSLKYSTNQERANQVRRIPKYTVN